MRLDAISNDIYVVAVNEANMQRHEYVTPEHFLYAALFFSAGRAIVERSGGDVNRIGTQLQDYFDSFLGKTSEKPTDSLLLVRMFETAAVQVANSERSEITVGDLLASVFSLPECHAAFIMQKNGASRPAMLKYISHHAQGGDDTQPSGERSRTPEPADGNREPAKKKGLLKMFAVNLTERARNGELDPLIGREDVLERTVMVLSRRMKNNPVYVGDAGVGKTAIVEGLAQRIVDGSVPAPLAGTAIYSVDVSGLVAGTRYRGDFEERLKVVLDEAAAEKSIIYFDEIHQIVGAGSTSGGTADAAGILKPYLTRGALRFIGSATYEDYKKSFEKDSALSRRFQQITVTEPDLEESVKILEGVKHKYEEFHGVTYSGDILRLACTLSQRHLHDRRLPDSAIDVIDETGARAAVNRANTERGILNVGCKDIERTIALMAKIPENSVSGNELKVLRNLEKDIKAQVFGQDRAIETVVSAIKAARSGLNDAGKPVASLLFVGPTGVGKTEAAKQLAACLGVALLRFDMSEYQEQHAVARLIGSPPGYVGYNEGGLLTDAVRKTPYCVLLLDEIEKAHADILNILLQVMDYGALTDNTGKKANFENVVLIMTSNAGAKDLDRKIIGFDDELTDVGSIDKEVNRVFSPEFRNRLTEIVRFNHINKEMAVRIAKKAIAQLSERLKTKNAEIKATKQAIDRIASKGLSRTYGAREIIRIVDKQIKKTLSEEVLFGGLAKGGTAVITIENDEITVKAEKRRYNRN